MKKILCFNFLLGFILLCAMGEPLQAKKFSFSYKSSKKTGTISLLKSFITRSDVANTAKPIGKESVDGYICPNGKIHFYYKIGPVKIVKGKGMPFKTRMVAELPKQNQKKDFGWQSGNGASKAQMNSNLNFDYYHTSGWNLNLKPADVHKDFKVTIYHNDLNSGKTIEIVYQFTVANVCQ